MFMSSAGVGSRVQEDEYANVNDDGQEHGNEDPEVVEPEAFQGVCLVDPALMAR